MRKSLVFATMLVVLFVFCGLTVEAEERQGYFTPADIADQVANEVCESITIPEAYEGAYWDYVLKELDVRYYAEITDDIYKYAEEFCYDVLVTVLDELHFQVYIKTSKEDALVSNENVIKNLIIANNSIGGINNWNVMQLNGLDIEDYDEIIELIEEEFLCQITETRKSEDEKSFSVHIETTVYYVVKGDTLSVIAREKGTTVEKLMGLNPQISNPDLIYPGWVLKIR